MHRHQLGIGPAVIELAEEGVAELLSGARLCAQPDLSTGLLQRGVRSSDGFTTQRCFTMVLDSWLMRNLLRRSPRTLSSFDGP